VPSPFWRWYLNLGTILLSTMVLKSQYLPMCKDGTGISVPSVLYVILSQHLSYQVIATIATSRLFRTASSSRCRAAWSVLTVRYSGLAVLPIPDLFIFAIAYVYTFFTQYMRSIAMQIVVYCLRRMIRCCTSMRYHLCPVLGYSLGVSEDIYWQY